MKRGKVFEYDHEPGELAIAMQELLDSQKQEMERYKPEEVARLDNAIFATYGTCVVLCVTNDTDTANAVIKEFVG